MQAKTLICYAKKMCARQKPQISKIHVNTNDTKVHRKIRHNDARDIVHAKTLIQYVLLDKIDLESLFHLLINSKLQNKH